MKEDVKMVIKTIQDNIFNTDAKHIAFAINTEGYNDFGFAGKVSDNYWPEIANCGKHELGTVISKTVGDKTFHALVCHSLKYGWGDNQDEIIKMCFDTIDSNGEPIATVAIGTGLIGVTSGANVPEIFCGMHESKQQIMLYSRFSLDFVIDCYNSEKETRIVREDLVEETAAETLSTLPEKTMKKVLENKGK